MITEDIKILKIGPEDEDITSKELNLIDRDTMIVYHLVFWKSIRQFSTCSVWNDNNNLGPGPWF